MIEQSANNKRESSYFIFSKMALLTTSLFFCTSAVFLHPTIPSLPPILTPPYPTRRFRCDDPTHVSILSCWWDPSLHHALFHFSSATCSSKNILLAALQRPEHLGFPRPIPLPSTSCLQQPTLAKRGNFSCFQHCSPTDFWCGTVFSPKLFFGSETGNFSRHRLWPKPAFDLLRSCPVTKTEFDSAVRCATRWTWFTILARCLSGKGHCFTAVIQSVLPCEPRARCLFTPASHLDHPFLGQSASQVVKLSTEGHIPELSGTIDNRWSVSLACVLVHQRDSASVPCHCPRIRLPILPPSFDKPVLNFRSMCCNCGIPLSPSSAIQKPCSKGPPDFLHVPQREALNELHPAESGASTLPC